MYRYPEQKEHSTATRFTQAVRALSYSPPGSTLAAGGDDGDIKLVDVAGSQAGHKLQAVSLQAAVEGLQAQHRAELS